MKYLKLFLYSGLSVVCISVIRCIQLMLLTNVKTGFFINGMETLGILLSVITFIIIILSSVLAISAKKADVYPIPDRSKVLGVFSLLAGVANLIEPIFNAGSFYAVPSLLIALRLITIFLTGLVFCWFGLSHLLDLNPHYNFSVVFVISWVLRLMTTFISFTGMSNITENLYDILMLITMLLFFLTHSKALCGIKKKHHIQRILAIGFPAILCTIASSVPNIVLYLSKGAENAHSPIDNPITAIFTAAYVAVYLVKICIESTLND